MTQSPMALQQELDNDETTYTRRLQIGESLAKMGDPRPGVAVKDGVPDIAWLPIATGGEVKITRTSHPDTPDDKPKLTFNTCGNLIRFSKGWAKTDVEKSVSSG